MAPSEAEQQLGKYVLLEKIAQGGMAEIFKAKTVDPSGLERLVVIKRILPHIASDPEFVDMLVDEAKIAVHFNHGNIAQIFDLGRVDKDYFIVMEYVDGRTLSQAVRSLRKKGQRLPLDLTAYIVSEICRGLSYIHKKRFPDGKEMGVVHRDISPQNIMLSYSGNIKIIDFGVAKAEDRTSQTESGVLKGKFSYMSPEQVEGKKIDHRSDIFSAGIVLWELITGERLFKRKSNPETVQAVKKAQWQPAAELNSHCPQQMDAILRRALARRTSQRYPSADEMASDLLKFLLEYFPQFRPTQLGEFLFKEFGPEPDEAPYYPDIQAVPAVDEEILEPTDKAPLASLERSLPLSADEQEDEELSVEASSKTPFADLPQEMEQQRVSEEEVSDDLQFAESAVVDLRSEEVPFKPRDFSFWLTAFLVAMVLAGGFFLLRDRFISNSETLPTQQILPDRPVVATPQQPAKITLKLKVLPPQATLAWDGLQQKPAGQGEWILRELLPKESHRLAIEHDGYASYDQAITTGELPEQLLTITLSPLPTVKGYLVINSDPPGATIFLNDHEIGQVTPSVITGEWSGEGRLGLFLKGYRYWEKNVSLAGGQTLNLEAPLEPHYAVFTIQSEPPGATIHINDREIGVTPLTLGEVIPEAPYTLVLAKPGYAQIVREVTPRGGEKILVKEVLKPLE